VKVHCDEDVASHIGPEPCVGIREGVGEASVGECAGQPLSRERNLLPGADAVTECGRQHDEARYASASLPRRGRRPWHAQKLFVREPGDLHLGRCQLIGAVRTGKARSRNQ
jgi:hypothetical protein